ncbi:MAG: aspartate aminotransferase family protein [Calditrichaeota bacterium]|nr:MAG: aspartate aminotransferase family protein [Calditrichota bacterium]
MNLLNEFKKYVCQTSPEPLGLEIARAEGPYLITSSGEKYLDLISGIGVASIGHGRQAVLDAIQKQASLYLHPMVYGEVVQEQQVLYAKKLADILPGPISNVFFTNSGTEAVEGALKTTRKYTGRQEIFSFSGCYHGDTFGSLSLQAESMYREPFEPVVPQIFHLPWNDVNALERISELTAAVIIEPIQAEGGIRVPTGDFMHALRHRCTQTGALLVADEVMTGFGRTGRMFATEHFGLAPDLIVLAKALGGGMPLGAFAGPQDIMKTLSENPPLAHVTTFGGHPVSCAAGLAALEILIQENLSERARKIGERINYHLNPWVGKNKILKEVRGRGCLIGLVFKDAATTKKVVEKCRENKMIIGWTLYHSTIIRMAPPFILTDAQIDAAMESLIQIIKKTQE